MRQSGSALLVYNSGVKKLSVVIVLAVVAIAGSVILSGRKPGSEIKQVMKIQSSAFNNNETIPVKYTCDGENINPPLSFSDIPSDAKSLALVMDDPDAPSGTWVHWTVWNIDPKTIEIVPQNAIEGTTSFGKPGYGGPCPPSGTHRYFFKLYALDNTLQLSASSTKEDLEKAMEGHIIGQTDLVGLYKR